MKLILALSGLSQQIEVNTEEYGVKDSVENVDYDQSHDLHLGASSDFNQHESQGGVVPHGEPLEKEDVQICALAFNLSVIVARYNVRGVLHSTPDCPKISRCNPEVVLFKDPPNDTAHNVCVDTE